MEASKIPMLEINVLKGNPSSKKNAESESVGLIR